MTMYRFSYPYIDYRRIADMSDNKDTAIFSLVNIRKKLIKELKLIDDQIKELKDMA